MMTKQDQQKPIATLIQTSKINEYLEEMMEVLKMLENHSYLSDDPYCLIQNCSEIRNQLFEIRLKIEDLKEI